MGTNYYLQENLCKNPCEHCKPEQGLHIGKSSYGWCFSLHVIPEKGINSLEDWKKRLENTSIVDEYGRPVRPEMMLSIITDRTHPNPVHTTEKQWLQDNYAVPGPNNLARHKIGHNCIGHGEGTWDLIVGEFS